MGYWVCPRCTTDNHLDAKSCWRCGYQYFSGTGSDAESSRRVSDFVREQRRQIQEDIKKSLDAAVERAKPRRRRLGGERVGPSEDQGAKPRPV